MKTFKTKALIALIGGIGVLAVVAGSLFAIHSGERPRCHRLLDGSFQMWMKETGSTNVYPNINGNSSNSLAVIEPYFGKDIQAYGYVPGLAYSDPTNLVLMYLKAETHYSWHGDTDHTVFSPRRWMVLSPAFDGSCPEEGDLLETSEFRKRLQATLAFLNEHQRPYRQTVANEQTKFLNSIKE